MPQSSAALPTVGSHVVLVSRPHHGLEPCARGRRNALALARKDKNRRTPNARAPWSPILWRLAGGALLGGAPLAAGSRCPRSAHASRGGRGPAAYSPHGKQTISQQIWTFPLGLGLRLEGQPSGRAAGLRCASALRCARLATRRPLRTGAPRGASELSGPSESPPFPDAISAPAKELDARRRHLAEQPARPLPVAEDVDAPAVALPAAAALDVLDRHVRVVHGGGPARP